MVLTDMDVDQRNGRGKGSCHGMLMQVVCMGGRLLYTISSVTGFCSGSLVLCKHDELDSIYNFSSLTSSETIVFRRKKLRWNACAQEEERAKRHLVSSPLFVNRSVLNSETFR